MSNVSYCQYMPNRTHALNPVALSEFAREADKQLFLCKRSDHMVEYRLKYKTVEI